LALLLALSTPAPARAEAAVRLCLAESAALPPALWRAAGLAARQPAQLDVFLVDLLSQRSAVAIEPQVLPWRRCLIEAQNGRFDGVFGLSHSPERAQWAAFPERNGQPNEALRLRRDSYHWYVRREQAPQWDGQRLTGLGQPLVGAVAGYSVIGVLRARGYRVDERAGTVIANLRMLALGRVDVAALLRSEAEPWLQREAALAAQLRRLDPPLLEHSYYLVFGKPFRQAQGDRVQRLWAELPALRESAWLQRAEAVAGQGGTE